MNEGKNLDELAKVFAAGDSWLMRYGIVTPILHNNIVLNIYSQFPKVQYVEYFMSIENRKIDVTVYLNFWSLVFTRRGKLIDDIFSVLLEYLHDYDITVRVKRYSSATKQRKGANAS